MNVPNIVLTGTLRKIERRIAAITDTESTTVDIHDVRVLHQLVQAQLDMAENGLLHLETEE